MTEHEYALPKEVSDAGQEFSKPGREWDCSGREFGQSTAQSAPRKKRRISPLMFVASAAAVVAIILPNKPADFPQPENFKPEYKAFLNEIMEAFESEDSEALTALTNSAMATEIWKNCLWPYNQVKLSEYYGGETLSGYYPFFFDGEYMISQMENVPTLWFRYFDNDTTNGNFATDDTTYDISLIYYPNGYTKTGTAFARREFYLIKVNTPGRQQISPRWFFGTSDFTAQNEYWNRGYTGRPPDVHGIYGSYDNLPEYTGYPVVLTGTFTYNDTHIRHGYFLENGTIQVDFGEHGTTELTVIDGYLQPSPYLSVVPQGYDENQNIYNEFELEDGTYMYAAHLLVRSPDGQAEENYSTIRGSDMPIDFFFDDPMYRSDLAMAMISY